MGPIKYNGIPKLSEYQTFKKQTTNFVGSEETSGDKEFETFSRNYKRVYRKVIKATKAYDVNKAWLITKNVSKTAWTVMNNKASRKRKQTNNKT